MYDIIKKAYQSIKLDESTQNEVLENILSLPKIKSPQHKFRLRKPLLITVAAAIMLTATVSAGAAVYNYFLNKHSIENNLGEGAAEKLESLGLVENQVAENEHFRITADTVICDGNQLYCIFTVKALDDKAKEFIKDYGNSIDVFETEGSFETSSSQGFNQDYNSGEFNLSASYMLKDQTDNNEKIKLQFFADTIENGRKINKTKEFGLDKLTFELDLTVNVPSITMVSEDGMEIQCSPIGCYDYNANSPFGNPLETYKNVYFICSDGSKVLLDNDNMGCFTARKDDVLEYAYIHFGEVVDIEQYSGIEINRVKYMKK